MFDAGKTSDWATYHMVKKLRQYVKSFSSNTGRSSTDKETDRQTDRQTDRENCYISVLTRANEIINYKM